MHITFMETWNFVGNLASMAALIISLKVLKSERKIEHDVEEIQHEGITVHKVPTRGAKNFLGET